MQLLTVGQLARQAKMSRTALLYYEGLGLLRPAARSEAGYRLYGPAEAERLRAIRLYREAGVPLHAIAQLLAPQQREPAALLEQRLVELDRQAQLLRQQQRLLARLLAHPETMRLGGLRTKARWVAMLRGAGFSDADMDEWHRGFEADAPDAHRRFLVALGLPAGEIAGIRARSRRGPRAAAPGA